ncbi:phosphatidate cytidylyltransferase [Nereida sp. MMG025]|uniref:phosphatidate cytidylyltransferase n=1 Tax=Nereida sp. MMG025 TaxID=2909981 RepID=UPI001F2FFF92|nr:phosphatidate cytidylyltransferase [Nereida sp. MMG025]MCF6443218.1 phosphatidate cytidylyltransferase [Nereida sp. MMG025]
MIPPKSEAKKWDDLRTRVGSGIVMALVGLAGIWAGGVWFQMLTVFVTAVMVWEVAMMIQPERPTPAMLGAALTASVLSGLLANDYHIFLPLLLIPALAVFASLKQERLTGLLFTLGILLAGWGLVIFRADFGAQWLFWLVGVVVVTDVAGYFAGRFIGGPKFWPKVSPKKTWSGTAAGWLASALVGAIVARVTDAGAAIILVSVALSFASQMGDIAESALKRRVGVKDSSTLIPGHGGLFDRFDGLLGASLVMLFVAFVLDVSGVAF